MKKTDSLKKPAGLLANVKLKYQLNSIVVIVAVSITVLLAVFLMGFSQLSVRRAKSYFDGISQQLELRVADTLKSIRDTSKKISRSNVVKDFLSEQDERERGRCYDYMSNMLRNEMGYNNYTGGNKHFIHSISIIDSRDRASRFYFRNVSEVYARILEDYRVSGSSDTAPYFTNAYYNEGDGQYYFGYVEPIRASISQFSSGPQMGNSVYICSVDVFQDIVDAVSESYHPVFVLADDQHSIFASSNKEYIGNTLEGCGIALQGRQDEMVMLDGRKCLAKVLPVEEIGWTLTYLVPYKDLTRDMTRMMYQGSLLGVAALALVILACWLIVSNVNRQLGWIARGCRRMESYRSTKYRLEPAGKNEIGDMVVQFNRMLDEIEAMTRQIVRSQDMLFTAEIEKRQASINALQSQINPHFLYNTLECIRNIAIAYGAEEIERIVISMADIFRYSIREDDRVTIRDEARSIQNYFEIMRVRHSDRFTLTVDIPEALLEIGCIKMVLQPLVENAVNHGLSKRNGPGRVEIVGRAQGDDVEIIVRDDGIGIEPRKLEALRGELADEGGSHTGIGIFNINRRLRLVYGAAYGLSIDSAPGQGTAVTVHLHA